MLKYSIGLHAQAVVLTKQTDTCVIQMPLHFLLVRYSSRFASCPED